MIWIESNAKQLAARIRKALSDTAQDPFQRPAVYRSIMAQGVSNHFDRLGRGGGDATALGGTVRWTDARHPKTLDIRGDDGFPLLDMGRSKMRKGFSTYAGFGSSVMQGGLGSQITLKPSSSQIGQLGAVHQYGLRPLGGGRGFGAGFTVPERPFLYWDRDMARDVVNRLRQAWEASA